MNHQHNLTTDPKLFASYALQASIHSQQQLKAWIAPYRALVDYYLGRTLKAPRIAIAPPRREACSTQLLINSLLNFELSLSRAAEAFPELNLIQLLRHLPNPARVQNPSTRLHTQSCKTREHHDDISARFTPLLRDSWAILHLPRLPLPPAYWTDIQPAERPNSAPRRSLQSQFLASIDPAKPDPKILTVIDESPYSSRRTRAKHKKILSLRAEPITQATSRDLYRDFPQLLDH